jgi:protein Mpv17
MAIIARIIAKFNSYYADHPRKQLFETIDPDLIILTSHAVITMMVTNSTLGGIADTVAQTITAVRQRAVRKTGGVKDDDTFAIEIHELDTKNPLQSRELIPDSKTLPPPFDFERLARFMGYGFMMAPVQLKWFQFLARSFPIAKASGLAPVVKRVACDQLIFAPAGTS